MFSDQWEKKKGVFLFFNSLEKIIMIILLKFSIFYVFECVSSGVNCEYLAE